MVKQTINLTLISDPKELSCKHSELHIETTLQGAYEEKTISKTLTKMECECLFGLVKDFINDAIERDEKKNNEQ